MLIKIVHAFFLFGKAQVPKTAHLMTLVAQKIPTKWYQIGIQLEMDTATLDAFEAQTSDQEQLHVKVYNQWKREQELPYTWDTIIRAVEEIGERSTAAAIREWLEKRPQTCSHYVVA